MPDVPFYERPDFLRLAATWRKKLKESGFEDLEPAPGSLADQRGFLNGNPAGAPRGHSSRQGMSPSFRAKALDQVEQRPGEFKRDFTVRQRQAIRAWIGRRHEEPRTQQEVRDYTGVATSHLKLIIKKFKKWLTPS